MGRAGNLAPDCLPGCFRNGPARDYPVPNQSIPAANYNTNLDRRGLAFIAPDLLGSGLAGGGFVGPQGATWGFQQFPKAEADAVPLYLWGNDEREPTPPLDSGCGDEERLSIGKYWASFGSGPIAWNEHFSDVNGTIPWFVNIGGQGSNWIHEFRFDCPVDIAVLPNSFQQNEFLYLGSTLGARVTPDEVYAAKGATVLICVQGSPSCPHPAQTSQEFDSNPPNGGVYRYSDSNSGPSLLVYRQVTEITFQQTTGGASNNWQMFLLTGPDGLRGRQCHDRVVPVIEDCGTDAQTPRWRGGCIHTTDPFDAAIFSDFEQAAGGNAGWEYSSDEGVTWGPAPMTSTHAAGDAPALHRWRQTFTIPPGYEGKWYVKSRGQAEGEFGGIMVLDTQPMDDGFKFGTPRVGVGVGWSSGNADADPGVHTFEFWEPGYTTAGTFAPVLRGQFAAVQQTQIDAVIVECLDEATGTVASTRYQLNDGTPLPLQPYQSWSDGPCVECIT